MLPAFITLRILVATAITANRRTGIIILFFFEFIIYVPFFPFLVNNITIYFFSQQKNCFLVLILQMKYSFFDFLGTP